MAVLTNVTGVLSPTNSTGLTLITTLIVLIVVNPFLGIFALIILTILAQSREHYGLLEAGNIPVVKPTLFLGSEPNFHNAVLHLEDIERFKEFGGIWGSYVGRTPYVFITDPEIIRLVFVKEFSYFADRQFVDVGSPVLNEALDFLPGEKWKTVRTCLTPLFTTAKLRQMSDVIATSASEFMNDLISECDGNGRLKIDCRSRLTTWLIDMFSMTTLGVRLEDSKNPDNKFVTAFRDMLAENVEYNFLHTLSLSYPFLERFAPMVNLEPTKLIVSTFRQVIDSRRKSGNKNNKDFLDVLCELGDRVPSNEFQNLGITESTILAQAINFFIAGYDTSATTLSHLLLHMAEHPEVQEKMHSELQEAFERRCNNIAGNNKVPSMEVDHELTTDTEIPYIVACINESLRLAPPLHRPERICTKDWNYKGISIKKGTITMMAAWAANRNPKMFPDEPDKFKPERFLPQNKAKLDSYALTSFGFGPRACIGTRFAYENLKLFTCNLVKNFRVEKRSDTSMQYKPGSLFLVGFRPLYLDLVRRK